MSAELRTPLARVRGLGSARGGTHHWIVQRLTAVGLVPLTIWFLWSALQLVGGDYADARSFLAQPWHAGFMATFVLLLFYHAKLGVQVVIEDYVHTRPVEVFLHLLNLFACLVAALFSVFAIVRIALGA
jgi:succinate dehydrogenase / fumarate reductase, membrane anchor subunit